MIISSTPYLGLILFSMFQSITKCRLLDRLGVWNSIISRENSQSSFRSKVWLVLENVFSLWRVAKYKIKLTEHTFKNLYSKYL